MYYEIAKFRFAESTPPSEQCDSLAELSRACEATPRPGFIKILCFSIKAKTDGTCQLDARYPGTWKSAAAFLRGGERTGVVTVTSPKNLPASDE